jgi:hypothetical protein
MFHVNHFGTMAGLQTHAWKAGRGRKPGFGASAVRLSRESCGAFAGVMASPGHTGPFIARLTRAYLKFEVKDAPKARGLRPSLILEFKVQIGFSATER